MGWAIEQRAIDEGSGGLEFFGFRRISEPQCESDRVEVSLLYFDMLQRDPDPGGFSGWVGVLNAGVPLTSVIDGFLNSAEYQLRF